MNLIYPGITHQCHAPKAAERRFCQIRAFRTHGLVIVARLIAPAKY